MDLAAAHTGFVMCAYALSAILLTGLVIYILARDRAMRAEMDRRKEQP
jgi:heme exporter protein CcmD